MADTNIPYFIKTYTPTTGGGWISAVLHESSGLTPDQAWTPYDSEGNPQDPITINQKFKAFSIAVTTLNLVVAGQVFVNFENDPGDMQDMAANGDYNFALSVGNVNNFYFPEGKARMRFIHGTSTTNCAITVYAQQVDPIDRRFVVTQ